MFNVVSIKRHVHSWTRFFVLALMLVGVASVVNAVPTSPVTSPTTSTFTGDGRECGNDPSAYAQTAALYPTLNDAGGHTGLLMYEINDQGVGTFLGTAPNDNTINDALTKAHDNGGNVTFFTSDTYTVSARPDGLCQFDSTQIPTDLGKPYECVFTCN